jgi:hypothetical protein
LCENRLQSTDIMIRWFEYLGLFGYIGLVCDRDIQHRRIEMRKFLAIFILLCFAGSLSPAQEEPIPPRRGKAPKMGLFGAFMPGYLDMDLAPVNEFITAGGGAPFGDKGVWMLGGGGSIYIMVLKNFRIGGMGMGGSVSSSSLDLYGVRRDADLSLSFGGVTIEYVVPITEKLDFAVGATVGGGGMHLRLQQMTGRTNTWTEERDLFGTWPPSGVPNITRTLDGSFFVLAPAAHIEYAILGWLGVRASLSHTFMMFPSWQVDSSYDLLNVPSKVKGNGLLFSLGIMVGTF